MNNMRDFLLKAIDDDRDRLIDFLSGLIKIPTPNPTGDRQAREPPNAAWLCCRLSGLGAENQPEFACSISCS